MRSVHVDIENLIGIPHIMLDTHHGSQVIDKVTPGYETFQDLAIKHGIANITEPGIAQLVAHLKIRCYIKNRNLISLRQKRVR